jgi:uncharacterized membrane protein
MREVHDLRSLSVEVCSVPVKSSWTLVVFQSLWVILVLVISVPVIHGMIVHERWEVAVFLSPFLIASVFIVRQVLWSARGRESILVADDGLVIRRTGSFWMWDVHIALHEFEGTSVVRHDPGFIRTLLGFGEHVLHIHYLGRKVRYGAYQDMSGSQAAKKRIDRAMEQLVG